MQECLQQEGNEIEEPEPFRKRKVLARMDAGASMRAICAEFDIKSSKFYPSLFPKSYAWMYIVSNSDTADGDSTVKPRYNGLKGGGECPLKPMSVYEDEDPIFCDARIFSQLMKSLEFLRRTRNRGTGTDNANTPAERVHNTVGYANPPGLGKLVVVPKNLKVNQAVYLELLCEHLSDSFELRRASVFQQDGAPAHTAKSVTQWLDDCMVPFLKDWPGNSLDLNPIENLWHMVKKDLQGKDVSSIPKLEKAIHLKQGMVSRLWAPSLDEAVSGLLPHQCCRSLCHLLHALWVF
ncbi:Transposable element Tcb2 transposase [Chionoecetes opilio]|uniref:Transposable element Tcb2 transposase n=1 Tax=Chionoecetes opilio TaxID=41210 RepID=A0A8J4XL87_CHIOP|nr:Transposable element Tcb2 transposase [Chionoecetes opilio]